MAANQENDTSHDAALPAKVGPRVGSLHALTAAHHDSDAAQDPTSSSRREGDDQPIHEGARDSTRHKADGSRCGVKRRRPPKPDGPEYNDLSPGAEPTGPSAEASAGLWDSGMSSITASPPAKRAKHRAAADDGGKVRRYSRPTVERVEQVPDTRRASMTSISGCGGQKLSAPCSFSCHPEVTCVQSGENSQRQTVHPPPALVPPAGTDLRVPFMLDRYINDSARGSDIGLLTRLGQPLDADWNSYFVDVFHISDSGYGTASVDDTA